MHVRKESTGGIRSKVPRNKIEKALSNGASQTRENSTENVKVRLYPGIQTGKGGSTSRHAITCTAA